MPEPEIRYTTTADGVSIAYYSMGDGYPLVVTSPVLWSHLRIQPFREYHRSRTGQGLGRGLKVVRYDARGTGLSDRGALDFGTGARLLDIEAVVERLELARFAVFGLGHGTLAAIGYAADHPERVSHLVLAEPYARGLDFRDEARRWDSLMDASDEDWERYTLTMANAELNFTDSEFAIRLASFFRESMTLESVRTFVTALEDVDVTPALGRVAVPTLVLHRARPANAMKLEWSRGVASRIRDARIVVFPARSDLMWTDEQTRIVEDFLGVEQEASAVTPRTATPLQGEPSASHMTAILFADIVDSTALTERMGDAAFRGRARTLDTALRSIITEAGGVAIDGFLSGDGVLATFPAASQAIDAALRCGAAGDEQALPLHLGVHAGDVIREANNVFGGAVNIASRISALSAPGEVLVSRTVAALARTSAGVTFEDRGEHALKGIEEAQRLFAVRAAAARA